ncbi:transient receptor potential cation channel subfamily A member 1 isoform X2 [Folsomia candida]|uniref:transient receptor potential cation channel subfamily A member 1 isoform X2 n=1 Tax=Folsomia candida TaxID=158441 RepID=UPI001604B610|nr:transient receptor potential cation channel subfamily A member 1 isoform X2 [Folsomia candida]
MASSKSSSTMKIQGLKTYIQSDVGTKLKNIVKAISLKRQPSVTELVEIAEQGNVAEFTRLVTEDPSKLDIRDGRGRASVHQATIRNHVKILEVVERFNGNLDLTDNSGNSCIHLAVEADALDALEFLLSHGADTKKLNANQQSCLHLAAEMNKIAALEVMAKFRTILDPNLPGENGRTALSAAAINDNEECMKILLYDIGACPRRPCKHGFFPIHEAAKHASSRSMEILLSWGEAQGSCSREEMISFFDAEGNVPLHSAVHGGDLKAVELCLRSGAKISTQQHDLSTPVHLACSQGSMEIIKLMFQLQPEEKETCLKSCDVQRRAPLHYASMFDHYNLVEYLIEQGAIVNALDKEKRTPLHLAASRNGWRTVKSLIRFGANITLKDNEMRNVLHTIVINGGDLDKILDEEIYTDFIGILEEKDKNGYTPLHYASKLGHIKTAAKLLQLGSSIVTKNNDGENVFHIACRYGRLQIIQRILRLEGHNSVINASNSAGQTPLHISSFSGHVRVVQALIKKGALLHRDHSHSTILHGACAKGHRETIKLILNVHSQLLDQTDKDGNTPLHVASMECQPTAVELLLTMNCALTYNFNGFSAIDFALQNKFTSVALVMVTHRTRGDEVLSMTAGKHSSIMLALIGTMPQVVTALLDRYITKSDAKSDSEQYHIKYDFKWLSLPTPENAFEQPKHKFWNHETKYLPILNGMVSYGRVELLSHDLSQKYLHMKWNGYGRFVHVTQLVLYLIFLVVLTSYASHNSKSKSEDSSMSILSSSLKTRAGNLRNDSSNLTKDDAWETTLMGTAHTYSIWEAVKAVLIFSIALICLLREGINIWRQKWNYILNSSNWVFWVMNVACLVMTVSKLTETEDFINPSASLATFLSWFYLLLFLQRFDGVGIYIVMFSEILHTLLRVLMIFSILIVAFGLAFYILLSEANHKAFSEIPISLMRTFSMMLGDMDFLNTFVYPRYCEDVGTSYSTNGSAVKGFSDENSSPRECGKNDRTLPHPVSSFLILAMFIILMPILLMNLLIGLAVGDIESVRRNAQLKRLAMQVYLHTSLEKTLPDFILRDKKEVIEYPNARKARLGLIDHFFKYFQPKSAHKEDTEEADEELSDDLMSAVTQSNQAIADISGRLENLETLLRLVCHKMELSTDTDFIDEGTIVDDSSPMSDVRTRFKRGVTLRLTKPRPPPPQRSDSAAI